MQYNGIMEKELTAREKFKEILDGTFIKNYDKPENNKEKIRIFCEKVQKLKPQKLFNTEKLTTIIIFMTLYVRI